MAVSLDSAKVDLSAVWLVCSTAVTWADERAASTAVKLVGAKVVMLAVAMDTKLAVYLDAMKDCMWEANSAARWGERMGAI